MSRGAPRLRPISSHEVDDSGELIVHDPAGRQLVVLNQVGAAIFELLDGETEVEEIADVLVDALGIERAQALRDVESFLHDLEARGMLEPDTGHEP